MARKSKIKIRRDEDFTEIDEELDQALQHLEGANAQVSNLLDAINEHGEAAMDGSVPAGGVTGAEENTQTEDAPPKEDGAKAAGDDAEPAPDGAQDAAPPTGPNAPEENHE